MIIWSLAFKYHCIVCVPAYFSLLKNLLPYDSSNCRKYSSETSEKRENIGNIFWTTKRYTGICAPSPTPFVYHLIRNGNEANEENYRITSSITVRKDVNLFTKKTIILYQYTSSPFLRSSKNYCACVYACVTSENQAF